MGQFSFKHPDREEYIEVHQSVHEEHIYIDEDGVQWERIWEVPQFNMGKTSIDPEDHNAFVDKTGKMKGTYGDMMDLAGELSEKRAQKYGEDPLKRKHFDDYEKRNGKKHLMDKKSSISDGDVSASNIFDE